MGIDYTHFLIPTDVYQSVVEVYDLSIMQYSREIMYKVAYTIAKHMKYIHMRATHTA